MKSAIIYLLLLFPFVAEAQSDTTEALFYYPNGNLSSKGWLVNGKPDGYWKTYYENGTLKTEGNRKNYQLDSLWIFYDENGRKSLEINYLNGKKNGKRISYLADEVIYENFNQDVKDGFTQHYDVKERLLKKIPFVNGLENGTAWQYDTLGTIQEIVEYKRGYITSRERINRNDPEGRAVGLWKWFFENGNLKQEGHFKNGLKNGIFKTFDVNGNLITIEKFSDGVKQESAEEVAKLELRKDYYPSGKVKVEATYRNGIPEGVRREFDEAGNVTQAFTFSKGKMTARGIVDNAGLKQGEWKEFYPDGKLKSEGAFYEGKKSGKWLFYYPQGSLEQEGNYNSKGEPEGEWIWYYTDGDLLRREEYHNGERDGDLVEYDRNNRILARGEYINNKEEGPWVVQNGYQREEGTFSEGMCNGLWKHYDQNNRLVFEGAFIEDNPNGKHTWYYSNGVKKEEGYYIMGRKNGIWRKWNDDGSLILETEYQNSIEKAYDGIKIPEEDLLIIDE